MSNSNPIHEAFVVENYQHEGKEQSRWHRVGTAFPNSSGTGFSLVIPDGVSLSGTIQILPKKEKQ